MYRHFIFDIDGTLEDTEKTGMLSLNKAVKELTGKEYSYDELLKFFGLPSREAAQILGCADQQKFTQTWEKYFMEYSYLSKPYDGIEWAVKSIFDAGRKLGVITSRNRFEYNYDYFMKQYESIFGVTITSDDSARPKPFPDPMLKYMELTGASRQECIFFGDSPHDFACASSAGVDFALADWKGRGLQGMSPKYVVRSADDIVRLLEIE